MLLRLALAALLSASAGAAVAQPGGLPSPVIVARAVEKTIKDTQSFVGSVTPVKRTLVGSAVAGRVIECPIEEGDRVENLQTLAQVLTETISLEIAAVEGELNLRRQQLAELENGSRPQEIQQAAAREAAAKARSDFLVTRRNRLETIARTRNAVTEDEVEEARANAAEAEQVYLQEVAAHELAVAGPRQEVIEQFRAQVQIQQAIVERLTDQRKKYTVTTKFAGYVVAKHTEVGAWLNQGDPVAEVVAIDTVEVSVKVGEQSLPFVVPDTTVQVVFPALPNRTFEGSVLAAIPEGDLRTRTFPVKVRVENEIRNKVPLLRPGMYARVQLPIGGVITAAVMVPKDALVLGDSTPVIYILPSGSRVGDTASATVVPVEIGVAEGAWIQVTGAVQQDDLVIIRGNERLRPGANVKINQIVSEMGEAAAR